VKVPQVECVWPLGALLGEGPVWSAAEQVLRFVDIKGGRVHRFDPATGQGATVETGGLPSFIVPAVNSDGSTGWLVGSGDAVFPFSEAGFGKPVVRIPQPGHNRTNDAAVDPRGRLWFGTMDDREELATGTFWCLDRGALIPAGGSAVVTNGPAFCPVRNVIYHVDSGARRVWRASLGQEPRLAASELFVELGERDGYPDGVVTDAEGCLWVALWDGWAVRRYGPDGSLLLHVPLPCARVTKIAFGGPTLSTAYVTTARTGLSPELLEQQPLAGALFAFDAGVSGIPQAHYGAPGASAR
jgi:D-xylonolactonase